MERSAVMLGLGGHGLLSSCKKEEIPRCIAGGICV